MAETIDRTTPIGAPVLADVAEYPTGYAWGAEPTGETRAGTLHQVEGDAGLSWCFVKVDAPGDGPEYMHVPLDRVRLNYPDAFAALRREPAPTIPTTN